jgi:hypothetical protein
MYGVNILESGGLQSAWTPLATGTVSESLELVYVTVSGGSVTPPLITSSKTFNTQGFVFDAGSASSLVRGGIDKAPVYNKLEVAIFGLSAGDYVLAGVIDRNNSPADFTWTDDLSGDEVAEAAVNGQSNLRAGVAQGTAAGTSFTATTKTTPWPS